MSDPIKEIIQELDYCIDKAQKSQTSANFELVQIKLSELNDAFRELHQALTGKKIQEIITKLEKNIALSQEETELLREWIVGDAINYLKNEKNFTEWLNLFNKLSDYLQKAYSENITPENVLHLRSLSKIAGRLIPNITFYINEKNRINSFERAISNGLDPEESKGYTNILKLMLQRIDM